MGIFDFFKGKKTERTEQEIDGIEVEPMEDSQEDKSSEEDSLVLEINAGEDSISQAVNEMLGGETIEIHRATKDVLYGELSEEEDENREETDEINGIVETEEQIEEPTEEVVEETAEEVVEETMEEVAEEPTEEVAEETTEEVEENADVETTEKAVGESKGFFAKLKEGLNKTRTNILGGVDSVLGAFTKIDEELFEELEEALIMADMGMQTTMEIVENLRNRVKRERTTDPSLIKGMLIDEIAGILSDESGTEEQLPNPSVVLVIGVNGVGKTTTIGKLANKYKAEGKKVLLAAADTFRAAAIDQLEVWGERANIPVVKHEENADPAAVVFDAVHEAKNKSYGLLICDTAGRLHNKKNLMEELRKMAKIIEREYPQAHKEVYLVLDATTGQNALQQAKTFKEVADITGIILTKLDGTAKGGIVVAIKNELQIPVRYIGVGEGIDDLQKFDATAFAKALFGD